MFGGNISTLHKICTEYLIELQHLKISINNLYVFFLSTVVLLYVLKENIARNGLGRNRSSRSQMFF